MKSTIRNLSVQVIDIAKHDHLGAKEHLDRSLDTAALKGDDATHLGLMFFRQSELSFAQRCFEHALIGAPKSALLTNFLGLCRQKQGDHTHAIDCFFRAHEIDVNMQSALDNLNNSLPYVIGEEGDAIAKRLSERIGINSSVNYLANNTGTHSQSPEVSQASKIRIAYLIDDIHSLFYQRLVKPVIESHNQHVFEVFGFYDDSLKSNQMHDQLNTTNLYQMTRQAVCESIAAHNLDVLIYVAADSPNRLGYVLENKVAHLQIDFPSPASKHNSAWCTSLFGWCYQMDTAMPTPSCAIESQKNVRVGYLGSHKSVSDRQVEQWLNSMVEVPNARFRLATPLLAVDGNIKAELQDNFNAKQVVVDLLPMPQTPEDYWAFLADMDIVVTAYPVVEPELVFDCLALGVPVIFRASESVSSTYIEKLMISIGLKDWIAESDNQAADILKNKASAHQERLKIKQFSHHRLRTSLLMHKPFFMREYENTLINLEKNND
jgi:predicted O-linked N-acetylglucosamine transferase (SPINDLY family)